MTDVDKGRQSSVNGFAHQHIVAGILMKKYERVSLAGSPLLSYDLLIGLIQDDNKEEIIRAQVKTSRKAVSFTGGSRGGTDRAYVSGVKTYRQSTQTSDVVIGLHPKNHGSFDLFFVPTILIEELDQKSISLNRIECLKNNYEMLKRCKDREFVLSRCREFGILASRK